MERGYGLDPKQKVVLIDTNVFVIDLRYQRDPYFNTNSQFLKDIRQKGTGFTTIVNLLELCGILSFNLNEGQLSELWFYFQDRYQVTVLPVPDLETNFPPFRIQEIFDLIKTRTSLGDALMLAAAKKYLGFVKYMVTWDRDNFVSKFPGDVLTPEDFIQLLDRE